MARRIKDKDAEDLAVVLDLIFIDTITAAAIAIARKYNLPMKEVAILTGKEIRKRMRFYKKKLKL